MGDFNEDWGHHRAGFRPIGYLLRRDGAKHWLRLHSLPNSKRYAETQEEKQILLSRQNKLAKELLGDAPCWLVQTHWVTPDGLTDIADANDPFRATRQFGLPFAFQFAESEEGQEEQLWNVHALSTRWTDDKFDGLLWEIAEGRAGPTLWMSSTSGAVFAPYDGGIDLFLPSEAAVDLMVRSHPDWLPVHPSGL